MRDQQEDARPQCSLYITRKESSLSGKPPSLALSEVLEREIKMCLLQCTVWRLGIHFSLQTAPQLPTQSRARGPRGCKTSHGKILCSRMMWPSPSVPSMPSRVEEIYQEDLIATAEVTQVACDRGPQVWPMRLACRHHAYFTPPLDHPLSKQPRVL